MSDAIVSSVRSNPNENRRYASQRRAARSIRRANLVRGAIPARRRDGRLLVLQSVNRGRSPDPRDCYEREVLMSEAMIEIRSIRSDMQDLIGNLYRINADPAYLKTAIRTIAENIRLLAWHVERLTEDLGK